MIMRPARSSRLTAAALLAALPAALSAATLDGIDVLPDEIRVQTSEPVQHSAFATRGPDRLVLELAGVKTGFNTKTLQGLGVWVKSVRSGQFKVSPPVTRIVLDLNGNAPYRVAAEGSAVVVRLGNQVMGDTVKVGVMGDTAKVGVMGGTPEAGAMGDTNKAASPTSVPTPEVMGDANKAVSPPQAAAGVPVTAVLYTLSAAFLLAALALRILMRKAPVPAPRRATDPLKDLGLSIDDNEGMIEGLQENFNSLSRRVAILEKKMDELLSRPASQSRAPADPKLEEEVKELRTVLKSIVKALQLPSKLL